MLNSQITQKPQKESSGALRAPGFYTGLPQGFRLRRNVIQGSPKVFVADGILYRAAPSPSPLPACLAVTFLCKWVKCPNTGDWKKLGRLVCYVKATIDLPLIIGSDGSGNMIWSIDASFAVHNDMSKKSYRCCVDIRKRGSVLSIKQAEG